ncbi:MAG: hypothetical protein K2X47_10840 [Bdellovibrionales bacterium]|nr:hypothetical protein [Bdellovibrionales bacterium]
MLSKATIALVFTGLLFDAEALAREAYPIDPEPATLSEARPAAGALAPEHEGCEISGGLDIKELAPGTSAGMGYIDHPSAHNIGDCWTQGLRVLKKQLSSCQAPNEFFVRMQFKKGPKLLRDERRGVCHGENRNIASEPLAPVDPPKKKILRHKKRWHHVSEPKEAQPIAPPETPDDKALPAEGL